MHVRIHSHTSSHMDTIYTACICQRQPQLILHCKSHPHRNMPFDSDMVYEYALYQRCDSQRQPRRTVTHVRRKPTFGNDVKDRIGDVLEG